MTSLNISACVIIFISIGYCTAKLVCGPNESVVTCPNDCPSDYCPKNRFQDKLPCPQPATCPPPACKCNFNYRRAANKTCIPTTDCPPFECCGENERYESCPSFCPGDDCANANLTGTCPFTILIALNCSPDCRCIPHYWRNNGVCVPYRQCPGVKKSLQEPVNIGPKTTS